MLKRLLDIVIASSALVLLSPVYALVAYKVKKNLGSPFYFVSYVRVCMVSLLKW